MKRKTVVPLLFLPLFVILACDSENEEDRIVNVSHERGAGMLLEISVQGVPEYMEPLTVTFTYWVDPEGWETPDTLVANAYVQAFRPMFELLSGDSAWVDTLHVDQSRTHSFVMRPLFHGGRFNCIVVGAYVDNGLTIGVNDCVFIDTP